MSKKNSEGDDKKLPTPPVEIASRRVNSVAQGLIGGILIVAFLPVAALAKGKQPSVSEDESLQARVAKIKQTLGNPLASGKISNPDPMWYDWYNWPNWGNWNNWRNWPNWFNW